MAFPRLPACTPLALAAHARDRVDPLAVSVVTLEDRRMVHPYLRRGRPCESCAVTARSLAL